MSTYWYMECLSHDPPLRSENEFTQHTDDQYFAAGIRLIAERPLVIDWDEINYNDGSPLGYYYINAIRFLDQHPKCEIGLLNEYGERRLSDGKKSP